MGEVDLNMPLSDRRYKGFLKLLEILYYFFFPKRYTGFIGLLCGLEMGPRDLGSQISQKRSSSFLKKFAGLAHQSAS